MTYQYFKEHYQQEEVIEYPNEVALQPLISICLLTYQHENYIEKCLHGILSQVIDGTVEVIIGEDNSTDKTREICIQFAKKYPGKIRLFLHHRKNNIAIAGKPSGNFNFIYSIFNARGKYIAICEGDDYWLKPNKLQLQLDFLEKNNTFSSSFHEVKVIKDSGTYLFSDIYSAIDNEQVNLTDFLNCNWLIPTSSFLFRKNALKMTDFFTKTRYLDFLVMCNVLLHGDAYYINRPLSVYKKNNPTSITNSKGTFEPILVKTTLIGYLLSLLSHHNLNEPQRTAIFNRIDRELASINTYANRFENSRTLNLLKLFKLFK